MYLLAQISMKESESTLCKKKKLNKPKKKMVKGQFSFHN